ncbi:MAG: magnesium/cobalt efflux protein [Gammaproteobacteria bacterium 28-57-27]|nr:MAG: magnesium/cobalt efflux protein [Gammaproteobacteria bacterium 28-57-27]
MDDISLSVLVGTLIVLIMLSAFFSGSETGLMTLNRYRLRHLASQGHRGARLAQKLLERPDKLIGLILLGNNFVNVMASTLATVIFMRLFGEAGIAVAAGILTLTLLIFGEVAPKTLAALHPERIAWPAAYVYTILQKILGPLVWAVGLFSNGLLRLFGVKVTASGGHDISREELRTILGETGGLISERYRAMLTGILDLEEALVEDIMVPRQEMDGIDLEADWEEILHRISSSTYARLPVYRGALDTIVGTINLRHLLPIAQKSELNLKTFVRSIQEPYYVPEGTSLHTQLMNFQREKKNMGLVVDEYGDILGLVTLEDILEEIVGEFTSQPDDESPEIQTQSDGSYLIDGQTPLREINKRLGTELPTDTANTLSGLILEHLQTLPQVSMKIEMYGCTVEVTRIARKVVEQARLWPSLESIDELEP